MGKVIEKFRQKNGPLDICPDCQNPLPVFCEEWGDVNRFFWNEGSVGVCCLRFLEKTRINGAQEGPAGWSVF